MTSSTANGAAAPLEGIDFHSLPWNLNLPEHHSYVHMTTNDQWTTKHYDEATDTGTLFDSVHPYDDKKLALTPATTSLNYGTSVWEGLKCFRTETGQVVAFRADRNYERMKHGAAEMCLPMPSRKLFLRAIQLAIERNAHLIPPTGVGMKLYVRPILFGSGQQLGLYPSPEFSFVVYVSPTGNYFSKIDHGLSVHLETRRSRAAPGGMGAVKCPGNYAAALKPLIDCKKEGFHDNLFLELDTYKQGKIGNALLQEMSAANVFFVLESGEIVTPTLERGTILPGVTRDSVLQLIEAYADELKEAMRKSTDGKADQVRASSRKVTVDEIQQATEAFCTGTAAELVPIARIATASYEEKFEKVFPYGKTFPGGPVTSALLTMLREAMQGKREIANKMHWLRDPFASVDEFCE